MKTTILLPHRFKAVGALIFVPGLILGILAVFMHLDFEFLDVKLPLILNRDGGDFFHSNNNNLTDEVALGLCIIGFLLLMFSREKVEDEFVQHQRLLSLQWAVLVNFVLLFVATWVVYNTDFLMVMMFNMLGIPVFFLLRFHWVLWKDSKN